MRLPRPAGAAVAAVAAAGLIVPGLAGCGGDGDQADAGPAGLVPARPLVYAEAVVQPEGDQREELDSALSKLLATDDPAQMLREALDEGFVEEDAGVTFSADIEEWLGERAGLFFESFEEDGEGAIIVETTDPDAAMATVDRAFEHEDVQPKESEYEGVSYELDVEDDTAVGTLDDFLVIGTDSGFRAAVDASNGDSFADSDAHGEEFDALGDDGVGAVYADPGAIIAALAEAGEIDPSERSQLEGQLGVDPEEPVVAGIGATADTLSLDVSAGPAEGAPTGTTDLLTSLPADAWLAAAGADFGESISRTLNQLEANPASAAELQRFESRLRSELGLDLRDDVLPWVGDVGAFVGGTSIFDLSAGVVIETTDGDASLATIEAIRDVLERDPSLDVRSVDEQGDGEGFVIGVPGAPVQIPVVQREDRVVVGLSEGAVSAALDPEETLGESEAYSSASDALGDEHQPSFLLDFDQLVELIDSTGEASTDPEYEQAKPYLEALDYLVAGVGSEGDRVSFRVVLGLQEAGTSGTAAAIQLP